MRRKTACLFVLLALLAVCGCGARNQPQSGDQGSPLKEVGRLPFGPAYDVCVVDEIAYVTGNRGVHIIDVGNPASPRELGLLQLRDGAFGISVHNGKAYIAGDTEGFFIADVGDPEKPIVVGQYSPANGITDELCVNGAYAYVVQREGRLLILDITNEIEPLLLDDLELGSAGGEAFLRGDYLFAGAHASGLVLFDVSEPSAPKKLSVVPGTRGAHGFAAQEDLLFLACQPEGLRVLDISNPAVPRVQGTFSFSKEANTVLADGNRLYAGDQEDGVIHVLDIKDPLHPVAVTSRTGYIPHKLCLAGDFIYVADARGLMVFQYVP